MSAGRFSRDKTDQYDLWGGRGGSEQVQYRPLSYSSATWFQNSLNFSTRLTSSILIRKGAPRAIAAPWFARYLGVSACFSQPNIGLIYTFCLPSWGDIATIFLNQHRFLCRCHRSFSKHRCWSLGFVQIPIMRRLGSTLALESYGCAAWILNRYRDIFMDKHRWTTLYFDLVLIMFPRITISVSYL